MQERQNNNLLPHTHIQTHSSIVRLISNHTRTHAHKHGENCSGKATKNIHTPRKIGKEHTDDVVSNIDDDVFQ